MRGVEPGGGRDGADHEQGGNPEGDQENFGERRRNARGAAEDNKRQVGGPDKAGKYRFVGQGNFTYCVAKLYSFIKVHTLVLFKSFEFKLEYFCCYLL